MSNDPESPVPSASDAILAAGGTPPRAHRSPRLHTLARGEGWIVVAKPPRVITHRNWSHRHEYAMLQRVRDMVDARVYPIHRLDRATSGCHLFAIDRALAGPLSAALTDGRKSYVAMVRGYFNHDEPVRVENPMKMEDGTYKDAASVVHLLGRSHDPRCSLLHVFPETGRYHQVRRHVRDLHHPVLRDSYHGDSRVNRQWRDTWGMARLGLHAHTLEITLPDGVPLSVTCPLFTDQAVLFRRMPWWEDAVAALPSLAAPPIALVDADPAVDAHGAAFDITARALNLESSP